MSVGTPLRILAAVAVAAVAACAVGVLSGSSGFGVADPDILWRVRVPRTLAGFAAGAALAVAGTLMQALTRNALADPYVLGVAGGASVGALLALLVGGAAIGAWALAGAAAAGAFAATALLFALLGRRLSVGARIDAPDAPVLVLLVGVMIGAGCSAAVSLVLSLADDGQLRGMVFWLLGDLSGATHPEIGWTALALALAIGWPAARDLDLMARGDAWASTLGVPVARRRVQAIVAASIATGGAVALAGAVGFVGLVVPHVLRRLGARSGVVLLPAAALAGGAFLVVADALARTVAAPLQLPVGVVSAAVGVPAFIALLLRAPRRERR